MEKFNLIDLESYERELLEQKARGIALRPVPTTFSDVRTDRYSEDDLFAIVQNRRAAINIYNRIKEG